MGYFHSASVFTPPKQVRVARKLARVKENDRIGFWKLMLPAEALNVQINQLVRRSGRADGQTRARKRLCDHSTTFQSSNIFIQLKK